jgi:hypothetical protein
MGFNATLASVGLGMANTVDVSRQPSWKSAVGRFREDGPADETPTFVSQTLFNRNSALRLYVARLKNLRF